MKRAAYCSTVCVPQIPEQWPIKKALTLSDVDITHPLLTLSRQQVDDHIVLHMTQQQHDHLSAEGQVDFNARDDDTGEMYVMQLKWHGSFYNLIGEWGKVVRGKGLDVGLEIYLRWANGCLQFSLHQQQNVAVPPIQMVPAPGSLQFPVPPQQQQIVAVPPIQMAAPPPVLQDQCPIKRVLTLSDVDANHPFLPLPRKLVEDHIICYWSQEQREVLRREEQVNVNTRDYDSGEIYLMKLKWRGNYYNLIGKWGTIIRQKGLGVGKEINLIWLNDCIYFSVP